jgi:hypothetical protein
VLDDELVIAVLSFGAPRVFYETALAQAAARPLILMVEEGRELAFDPRNAKVMTYRLDTESVVSAVNVSRLPSVVREIEDGERPTCHGFRPGTAALGGGCENSVTVYERSPKFSYDRRLEMIREAETRIDIMGVANLALALHPDTAEAVRGHGGGKVEIRILQCAPSNAGLVSMLGARRSDELGVIQDEIERAADAWRRIADAPGLELSLTIRRAQVSLPMANALITDRAVVATPYLRSKATADSPTLYAASEDAYHAALSGDFDLLWSEASTVFRADRTMMNGHGRAHAANGHGSSCRALPATPVTPPAPPARTPEPEPPVLDDVLNGAHADGHHHDAPEAKNASNGNKPKESVHHRLFGSPEREDAPEGERLDDEAALRPKPPTVNARGHAIIRSVC